MISDPIMGVIADRTQTRWGKFRPYILWMALPYSVLAVLAFSTPDLGSTGKVIYAGATYLLRNCSSWIWMETCLMGRPKAARSMK